jgi:hypothetical protein
LYDLFKNSRIAHISIVKNYYEKNIGYLIYNMNFNLSRCITTPWVIASPWQRGPVLDDPDGHVGERMLLTGQRGGEVKNNPQRIDETRKSRKITHLRQDNSEIKLGPPG